GYGRRGGYESQVRGVPSGREGGSRFVCARRIPIQLHRLPYAPRIAPATSSIYESLDWDLPDRLETSAVALIQYKRYFSRTFRNASVSPARASSTSTPVLPAFNNAAALSLPNSSMIFRSSVNLSGWNFSSAASSSRPSREVFRSSRLSSSTSTPEHSCPL